MSQVGGAELGKLCAALIAAVLLNGCAWWFPHRVQPSEILQSEKISDIERPAPYSDALAFYLNNRCDAAWDVLWPLAKREDNDARFIIAESLVTGCDLPYREHRTSKEESQLSLMLEAYAISEPVRYPLREEDEKDFRERLSLGLFLDGNGAKAVVACYRSNASAKECLNKAISLGVIKPFKELAGDVDQRAKN